MSVLVHGACMALLHLWAMEWFGLFAWQHCHTGVLQ